MGLVFVEAGGKVSACLPNVHFAAFTRNLVNSGPSTGVLHVLVSLEVSDLVGCGVEYPDAVFLEDPLDVVGGVTYVGESNRTNIPIRLT